MLLFLLSLLIVPGYPKRDHPKRDHHFLHHEKPRILSGISSETVKSGEKLVLKCSATGNPAPVVVINRKEEGHHGLYYRDPKQQADKTQKVKRVFNPVLASDQGWYVCIALNQHSIAVSEAYITVENLCEETCSPPKTCVAGECTCTRRCSASYSPVCGSDCQTYFNKCRMEQDACNQGTTLSVLFSGLCNGKVSPPSITVKNKQIGMVKGEGAVLGAVVTGNPTPSVTWYKILDKYLHSHTKVGEGADLRVFEEGVYFGEAVNCRTKRVKSVMVTVSEVTEELLITEMATTEVPTKEITTEEQVTMVTTTPALTTTPPLTTEFFPGDLTSEMLPGALTNLPRLEDMRACTVLGDSHVMTFDSWKFEFQGLCTYVLGMDCSFAAWYVYVRYADCETGRCLDIVDIISNGNHLALSRGWAINNNGVKFEYKADRVFEVNGFSGILQNDQLTISLKDEVFIRYDGYSLVQLFVPDSAKTCGLCGNNDQDKSNDVKEGRGKYQTSADAVNFAESWRLRTDVGCGGTSSSNKLVSGSCSKNTLRQTAQRECRKLFKLDLLNKCVGVKELKFLYESCRYDACYGEEPLKGYSNVCYSGQAIANLCGEERMDRGWEEKLGCGSRVERRDAVFKLLNV